MNLGLLGLCVLLCALALCFIIFTIVACAIFYSARRDIVNSVLSSYDVQVNVSEDCQDIDPFND